MTGDRRLGTIDIVLVSYMHGAHAGNAHTEAPNAGSCASPDPSVSSVRSTLAAEIAAAKKSRIVTGGEMPPPFAAGIPQGPTDTIFTN